MSYTFLFYNKKENIWFGCSYDWRDLYFEASIGDLYKFKDCMNRVVVVGDYNTILEISQIPFIKVKDKITLNKQIEQLLINIRDSFDEILKNFHNFYQLYLNVDNKYLERIKPYLFKKVYSLEELPII